jgi:hypothetical protein
MPRLIPLAEEVAGIVHLKLRSIAGDDISEERLTSAASLVTNMAASLTLPPLEPSTAPGLPDSTAGLEDLRWVWSRLI